MSTCSFKIHSLFLVYLYLNVNRLSRLALRVLRTCLTLSTPGVQYTIVVRILAIPSHQETTLRSETTRHDNAVRLISHFRSCITTQTPIHPYYPSLPGNEERLRHEDALNPVRYGPSFLSQTERVEKHRELRGLTSTSVQVKQITR